MGVFMCGTTGRDGWELDAATDNTRRPQPRHERTPMTAEPALGSTHPADCAEGTDIETVDVPECAHPGCTAFADGESLRRLNPKGEDFAGACDEHYDEEKRKRENPGHHPPMPGEPEPLPDQLLDPAVDAALRWRREQARWVEPIEELAGMVGAAVRHLLDTGLVVLAEDEAGTPTG